jgi:hypothetical protein
MKKLLLAFALCAVTAQPVLAQQAFRPAPEQQDNQLRSNREVIGTIIGGIIGGVIAVEVLERHERYERNPRPVVCYAQNYRRQIYQQVGHRARATQWQALAKCEQHSRYHCRPLGCQKVGRDSRWPERHDPRWPDHPGSWGR